MVRDPRYDILFEPLSIGPLVARNRFFQVPHGTGMGNHWPRSLARFRGQRAEGGWAVVCTEEAIIHLTSDSSPATSMRLLDAEDVKVFALVADAVHEHGALFGVEIIHGGMSRRNRYSHLVPFAPSHGVGTLPGIIQPRGIDKADIRELRKWHRAAALRAREAGADLVYVYAAHNLGLPMHFLSRRYNHRTDEYGGSLENRARLLRELIEDTKSAVGDRCAVAVRFAVDECLGEHGFEWDKEGRDVVALLAELPDLWDVNLSPWENDSVTSRFAEEGYQESYIGFVKSVTSKPVVGVGRYTSPDAMAAAVRGGVIDFVGAARPAIADPFLPKKIEEGRIDDIRECIGCNICVAYNRMFVPIRCTQNPVVGEEWRRGWHSERIPAKASDSRILVVGGGPAGLEAARALGQRGYTVSLAERGRELGGRVTKESRLPGLAQWARVRDWRVGQIARMANVEMFRDSAMDVEAVLEFGARHVLVATGARWRRDGVGYANYRAITGSKLSHVRIPEDIYADVRIDGPVVVFDDDHFYLGGVLAEKIRRNGLEVTLVTPASEVSSFTLNTLEQSRIQSHLLELGVHIEQQRNLTLIERDHVVLACVFTGRLSELPARSVVMVTSRCSDDSLYRGLVARQAEWISAGVGTIEAIGDCRAPSTIAAAVHDGHRAARAIDGLKDDTVPFARERIAL